MSCMVALTLQFCALVQAVLKRTQSKNSTQSYQNNIFEFYWKNCYQFEQPSVEYEHLIGVNKSAPLFSLSKLKRPPATFFKKLFVFIFWDEFKKRVWSGGEADRAMKILNGWNKKINRNKKFSFKKVQRERINWLDAEYSEINENLR